MSESAHPASSQTPKPRWWSPIPLPPAAAISAEIDQYLQLDSSPSPDHSHLEEDPPEATLSQPVRSLRPKKPIRHIMNDSHYKLVDDICRRRKKPHPSPFHNYQKHLSVALRCLIELPLASSNGFHIEEIAGQLWEAFQASHSPTKRILHLVFNAANEHHTTEAELTEFGLTQIYHQHSEEDLAAARDYLAQVALWQVTPPRIEQYLQGRRLRDPQKFRTYLELFLQELREGCLKTRFTNHFHKWQVRSLFDQSH